MGTYRSRALPGLRHLDASNADAVRRLLAETSATRIFFPAAEPHVEWCEAHPSEARARNLLPLRVTLEAARGIPLVSFSSDYVFDGRSGPYAEDAETNPLSVYGRIKLEVERLTLAAGQTLVRTTTVWGPELPPGKNFVLRLIASLRRGERVVVPADQVSTPTYARDLARAAMPLPGTGGIWHLAGPQLLSRSDFARLVAREFALDESLVEPVPTSTLGQLARRPLHGGLRSERALPAAAVPHRSLVVTLAELRAM